MTMTTHPCPEIQERIAVGEILREAEQAHVLACPDCSRLANLWLAMDGEIAAHLDEAVSVPPGFADRVMTAIEEAPQAAPGIERWLGRRSVQLVLANLGVAVAITNIVRFVLGVLMPAAGLGGLR
jgi:anti-sigma factor RsiW